MSLAVFSVDPTLVRHLSALGRWINLRYAGGVQAVIGPYGEVEARRRAAFLLNRMPGAIGVQVDGKPELREVEDGRRHMVLIHQRTTGTRIAFGPFHSRKQAFAKGDALIDDIPDSIKADYDVQIHYCHDSERYKRTGRAS